jgi:SNF2 family DNA or RNA helicase
LRQFGTGIRVRHYGADASDLTKLAATSDLVLTTYARLRLESKDFHAVKWSMVVLDEAHAIKNSGTQIAEVVRGLKAKLRVALTGTPVENRAGELWSLMDWLNPGYLGDQASFSQFTSLARSSSQKRMLMAPLRVCLDPLILRRLKKDPEVALGLPDKIFKDESFDLSSEQQLLYQSVVELCIAEGAETLSLFQRKGMYLRAILHLKQICIHPDLFLGTGGLSGTEEKENPGDPLFQESQKWSKKIKRLIRKLQMQQTSKTTKLEHWIRRSGKIAGLNELIADHRSQCRGILIFTQYLGAAEMLQRMISLDYEMPIPPLIHGGLSPEKRQQLVDEFNSLCASKSEADEAPVLILSLKVGGSGLNLTGADCVIHLDRWWNPAVEDQATDRAHRIGQTSQVLVQTLTSPGTIEESVAAKFESKRQLSADLLGSVVEGDFGDDLRDEVGFLQLVDPQGMFRKSLRVLN